MDALDVALGTPGAPFTDFVTSHLPDDSLVLIVIEQLEELLTLGNAERFDVLIAAWLSEPGSRVRVISTFRSDFLHRIEQLPALASMLNRAGRYHLRAVDDQSLVQVVEGMAQRSGLRLADGLAERMGRDAGQSEARLSLIGHALQTLWLSQEGGAVSHSAYEGMQGVVGALTAQVERLLDELGPNGRGRAKWIILGLIQPGHGSPDTRRPRMCGDLLSMAGDYRGAEETLLLLAGLSGRGTGPSLRLIVLKGVPGSPLPMQEAELVHEMLITQVPAINRWLEEERALLARCSDLEEAAAAWERAGRPKQGLPAGTLLAHLSGPPTRGSVIRRMISERATSFLATARQLDSQRRWIGRAVVVALVFAAIFSALSARNARQKEQSARESSHRLATAVRQVASDTDWELARMPGTLNARRDLLSVLLRELTDLPEAGRASPETITALIEAHHRRGDLALSNETLASADAHFSTAHSLLTRLASAQPSSADLDRFQALNLSKRGKVALARGDFESARLLFSDSVTMLEAMAAHDSSDEARRCLAVSYGELASALALKGLHADAVKLYARAEAVLAANNGFYDRCLLALNQRDAAEVAIGAGSLSDAERLTKNAREILQAVSGATMPPDLFADSVTARIFNTDGELAAHRGSREHADELLAQAIRRWEALLSADPTNKGSALGLAQSLARQEAIASAKGDRARSLDLLDRRCHLVADALTGDPGDTRFRRLACKK
jgi:tetratricopeptide (TPR) repeat protein